MKVLHLSNTPISNAPHNLAECQRKYGIEASLLLHRYSNTNKNFVGNGTLWTVTPKEEIIARINDSDIIHFHNFAKEQLLFSTYPDLWGLVEKKPRLIQYHSPRFSIESFETTIADKTMKHAVIAQYHVREYPECEFIVPNVIPMYLKEYSPMMEKWDDLVPTVSYAPSNITLKGWDNKGFFITQPILQRLQAMNKANPDIMIGVAYKDCLSRKRWSHIGIDEVMTGSYHLSSLEYLSMGCVTIGNLDVQTKSALNSVDTHLNGDALPWIEANQNNLMAAISGVISEGMQGLRQRAEYNRGWMEKHWNPEVHVQRFKEIYAKL